MRLYNVFELLAIGLLLYSCNSNLKFKKEQERITALNAMQQADVDFSNLCRDSGMRKAFLSFIDDEGVMLRPGRMPIVGADAVDFVSSINDSSFILTWRPDGADISQAGDMGYTYGVYDMQVGDSSNKGTYVTIWKKNAGGVWKFCLDTGNEGIGSENEPVNPQPVD